MTGVTVTVVEAVLPVPPELIQVKLYVEVIVGFTEREPDVALVLDLEAGQFPELLQTVAFVDVHEMFDLSPALMVFGDAVISTVGRMVLKRLNVAVTEVSAFTVTAQVFLPLHAPDHPTNVELAGRFTDLSVTTVPFGTVTLHDLVVELHDPNSGVDEMDPVPVPFMYEVRVTVGRVTVNFWTRPNSKSTT